MERSVTRDLHPELIDRIAHAHPDSVPGLIRDAVAVASTGRRAGSVFPHVDLELLGDTPVRLAVLGRPGDLRRMLSPATSDTQAANVVVHHTVGRILRKQLLERSVTDVRAALIFALTVPEQSLRDVAWRRYANLAKNVAACSSYDRERLFRFAADSLPRARQEAGVQASVTRLDCMQNGLRILDTVLDLASGISMNRRTEALAAALIPRNEHWIGQLKTSSRRSEYARELARKLSDHARIGIAANPNSESADRLRELAMKIAISDEMRQAHVESVFMQGNPTLHMQLATFVHCLQWRLRIPDALWKLHDATLTRSLSKVALDFLGDTTLCESQRAQLLTRIFGATPHGEPDTPENREYQLALVERVRALVGNANLDAALRSKILHAVFVQADGRLPHYLHECPDERTIRDFFTTALSLLRDGDLESSDREMLASCIAVATSEHGRWPQWVPEASIVPELKQLIS